MVACSKNMISLTLELIIFAILPRKIRMFSFSCNETGNIILQNIELCLVEIVCKFVVKNTLYILTFSECLPHYNEIRFHVSN